MTWYASLEGDPDDEVLDAEECDKCGMPLDECVCDEHSDFDEDIHD